MTKNVLGAGYCFNDISNTDIKMNFRFPHEYIILQAEKSGINKAKKWLRYHKIYGKNIVIATDSKVALKSLMYVYV